MVAALRITAPLLLFLLLATTYAAAQNEQNSGIEKQLSIFEKLQDYNRFTAESTLRNVSFLIAFLGGILSFLAPCTVALLPAFLATTAKSRRSLTLEMLVFFAGFSLTFVIIGIALTSLGKISFTTFQQDAALLVQTAGVILVFLGLLMFFGKGFSFIHLRTRLPKDSPGTFLFGALFAVGWSACIGPIIAGIFTMAAVFHNYAYTALLLFFYALGLAIPLFAAAFAYDKFNIAGSRLLQGFNLTLKIGKSELVLTSANMVSGLLMMFLGIFFVLNRGTTPITAADLLGMIALLAAIFAAAALIHKFIVSRLISGNNARKIAAVAEILAGIAAFAYITKHYAVRTTGLAERLSDAVLENTAKFNFVAAAILVLFIAVLAYFIKRQLKGGKK
ncbi:cytochrome c biogenesis protein CcdA [Candidatus Woesearchaeota archaeon]|nr:cytochrome c biogenesis protein CcdA [Candidatus Woesearchaeota archaeon]